MSLCLWNAAVTMAFRILLPIGSWECLISPWNEPIKEFRCFWTCQVQLIKGCMERKGRKQQIWDHDLFTESIFWEFIACLGSSGIVFPYGTAAWCLECPKMRDICAHVHPECPFQGQQGSKKHVWSDKALLHNSQKFLKFNDLWNHQDFPKICSQRICKTGNLRGRGTQGCFHQGKPQSPHIQALLFPRILSPA